jgi:restriction system protein
MRPVLEIMSKGEAMSNSAVIDAVCTTMGLSETDRAELVESGMNTKVRVRIPWAMTYLRQAKLIERVTRGQNRITRRGTEFLENAPSTITARDLRQFPEFVEFQSRTKRDNHSAEPVQGAVCNTIDEIENRPPQERMTEAYREHNEALAADLLARIKTMDAGRFEGLIVQLMLVLGYGGADPLRGEVLGKSGDGGIDGVIREDRLGLDNIYLQAKRWDENTVGRPEVQKFVGALTGHGAAKGVFITSATFSRDAYDYAAGLGHIKVKLIDGATLARLMIETGLGVATEETFTIKRIDSDFFEVG